MENGHANLLTYTHKRLRRSGITIRGVKVVNIWRIIGCKILKEEFYTKNIFEIQLKQLTHLISYAANLGIIQMYFRRIKNNFSMFVQRIDLQIIANNSAKCSSIASAAYGCNCSPNVYEKTFDPIPV